MSEEEEKMSCVHVLCPQAGPADKYSGEQMFPLTSYHCYTALSKVWYVREGGWQGVDEFTCVHIPPKQRHCYQLGQVLKLFPLVLFQLLSPEINWH